MLETLLGGLLGGVFRLVPEVLKFMDAKNERAHELSMQAANLESDKAKYANQLAVTNLQVEASQFSSAVSALQEALKGQFQLTGNKLIDGLNMSVRPVLTYSFFALYAGIKLAALTNGAPIASLWGVDDQALFSGIMSFYFLGRVFDRAK
jgi:CHAT domain-containing protein